MPTVTYRLAAAREAGRVLGLTATTGPPGKLRTAATAYQTAIDEIIRHAGLAA